MDPQSLTDCQSCGACCAFDNSWPRFTLESEAELSLIPARLVAADLSGMRCRGARCSALAGEVGKATSCTVYAVRPDVCRACVPGGDDCQLARVGWGMASIDAGGSRPEEAEWDPDDRGRSLDAG